MAGKQRPLRVIFVDRAGAQSIWSLMAAISESLLRAGHEPMFCVFDDGRSAICCAPVAGRGTREW